MTVSGVSFDVARCRTCVTPSIASSTTSRSAIEPRTTSSRGAGVEHAVVAQRAHGETRERPDVGRERPPDEGLPDLARRARDENAIASGFHAPSMTVRARALIPSGAALEDDRCGKAASSNLERGRALTTQAEMKDGRGSNKVFFAHDEPRFRDNEQRVLKDQPIRGGPLPADQPVLANS